LTSYLKDILFFCCCFFSPHYHKKGLFYILYSIFYILFRDLRRFNIIKQDKIKWEGLLKREGERERGSIKSSLRRVQGLRELPLNA
jgi:hypothetical protein